MGRANRSGLAMAALAVLLAAGCIQVNTPGDAAPPDAVAPGAPSHLVVCRPVERDGRAILDAVCRFRVGTQTTALSVRSPEGTAALAVAEGSRIAVSAEAPGHVGAQAQLTVTAPVTVRLVLPASSAPAGGGASNATAPRPTTSVSDGGDGAGSLPAVTIRPRSWQAAVTVLEGGGAEPHLAVDADGRIFYSPTSVLYRSTDGGKTFQEVSPGIPAALPVLGGDTGLHLAPDGSVWWTRYWGYAGGTIGCTSRDHADTWTCDNLAIPGATDRMWIAGKDGMTGYLQTNEGLYQHVWAMTTTGSQKYTPTATTTSVLNVRNGNMLYDATHDAFWQIEFTGGTQRLYRVDGASGVLSSTDTGIPNTYALPWLAEWTGVLWTTGEGEDGDGVVAARSTDAGRTWTSFPIASAAKSVSFSYIGAGPEGRVVLVYYGSDKPGPSASNGGVWSLYVAETDNGDDADPVWLETRLVDDIHEGNLCIGLNCEETGGDPDARFAGDLIGAWVDTHGDAHLAYMEDQDGTFLARYRRQSS